MTPQELTIARDGAVTSKVCSSRQCELLGIPQPSDSFAKNSSKKDGLQSFCRRCLSRVKKAREKSFPRVPDDQVKICSECQIPKPAIEFYSNKYRPDGVGACCKMCASIATSEWTERNKDRHRSTNQEWANNNPEKTRAASRRWRRNRWTVKALKSCRSRAAKKGVPFDMTKDDLLDKHTGKLPELCPIFPHIKIDYEAGPDRRCWPSVDRIVPELGYITGNVWVISNGANMWKTNGSNPAERRRITQIMTGSPKKLEYLSQGQGLLFAF